MRRIGQSAGRSGLAGLAATGLVVGLLTLPHAATAPWARAHRRLPARSRSRVSR